jgi:hypothetical protein
MAKQLTNREKLAFKLDHLTDSEIEEVAEYVAIMEAMRREQRQPDTLEDELVASLSSAYENRRAQQAFEWDAIRQRADLRNISPPLARRAAHR